MWCVIKARCPPRGEDQDTPHSVHGQRGAGDDKNDNWGTLPCEGEEGERLGFAVSQ